MRQAMNTVQKTWTCHWSHIEGPAHHGRPSRTLVWICEHPYRTMRTKPCEDCPGNVRAVSKIATVKAGRKRELTPA
ncbi:MAG TPA: hypothetical protein VES67_01860 [Vicinamibacterales bacterium]|nr:hypothetical protein [Vicinamibacterales bacterium]